MNRATATVDERTLAAPGSPRDRRWRAPLHVFIGTLFTLLIVVAGGVIGGHNYLQNRDLTIAAADDLFGVMVRETRAEIEGLRKPVELLIDLLARQRLGNATTLLERMGSVPYLASALEHEPALSALYVGYDNGDFFLLRRLAGGAEGNARFSPPAGAAYVVQSIDHDRGGTQRGVYVFLDAATRTLEEREVAGYRFDPRLRGWYAQARAADHPIRTAPYVFFTTREVGITLARRSSLAPAVVGADLTLRDLSRALARHALAPSSELVLFTSDGTVLASRKPERIVLPSSAGDDDALRVAKLGELGAPPLDALAARFDPGVADARQSFRVDGRDWEAAVTRLDGEGRPAGEYLALLTPDDELLGNAWRITRTSALLTLVILLASVPLVWLLSRLVSDSLHRLTDEARAVRRFDFANPIATRSAVAEIHQLAGTMDAMKRTIRRFLDIAETIGGERKFDRLLARVLVETLSATGSRAGAIYLADDTGALRQTAVRTVADDGAAMPATTTDDLPAGHVVRRAVAGHRAIVERLAVDREARVRQFGPIGGACEPGPYAVVAVPLHNRQGADIGALCLFQEVAAGEPPPDLVAFVEALSGTIAIAIDNQSLLRAQKALLEAIIRLVAGAIDAKSPYTGGHCQRVPELARMLAQAACDARDGAFGDFSLTEDDWEALHIAAWLHDCGKVTTPEYVVDKATKLETIYDRLHEIRMRFEVVKRDAEIAAWRRIADGGDRTVAFAELAARHRELDAEFAFVAACNEGGESMAPAQIDRLREIGRRTWQRTLDDCIGLSREERARRERWRAAALPVTEPLLADKPEHVIERDAADRMAPDNRWGFRLDVPAHRLNLGELYNLSIDRGTLTAEERFTINDHIVRTIMMLSELPLTGHLRCVPEVAGGHHEKMDGTGYPRRLSRDEMSVQARIMAIADVFEALTAADRPYKKAKTLSESIRIMARMRDAHHLDPDLFELFLTAGVHRAYAARFLDAAQIDEVDVGVYVKTAT